MKTILQHLHDNGFSIYSIECEWAVQETSWLGGSHHMALIPEEKD
jgi:hypothetical protein